MVSSVAERSPGDCGDTDLTDLVTEGDRALLAEGTTGEPKESFGAGIQDAGMEQQIGTAAGRYGLNGLSSSAGELGLYSEAREKGRVFPKEGGWGWREESGLKGKLCMQSAF